MCVTERLCCKKSGRMISRRATYLDTMIYVLFINCYSLFPYILWPFVVRGFPNFKYGRVVKVHRMLVVKFGHDTNGYLDFRSQKKYIDSRSYYSIVFGMV